MAIYLVQHGKNVSKDVDPQKGLSEEGRETVRRVAKSARANGISVSEIVHSGKKRARETAEIFASILAPSAAIREVDGLAPMDDVARIDVDPPDRMLVGHLPFMERLVNHLVTGTADRTAVIKFQNGGIVCLDRDAETGGWQVRWALYAHLS